MGGMPVDSVRINWDVNRHQAFEDLDPSVEESSPRPEEIRAQVLSIGEWSTENKTATALITKGPRMLTIRKLQPCSDCS